jgi:hypothetical protein
MFFYLFRSLIRRSHVVDYLVLFVYLINQLKTILNILHVFIVDTLSQDQSSILEFRITW